LKLKKTNSRLTSLRTLSSSSGRNLPERNKKVRLLCKRLIWRKTIILKMRISSWWRMKTSLSSKISSSTKMIRWKLKNLKGCDWYQVSMLLVRTWVMIRVAKTKLLELQVCKNALKIRDSAKRKTLRNCLIYQIWESVIKRNLDWHKLKVDIQLSNQVKSTNQQREKVMYSKQVPTSLTHTSNLTQACLTVVQKSKQSKPSLELSHTERSWTRDLVAY